MKSPGSRHQAVVFAGHFAPHVGGVERYTECLWSRMVSRDWDAIVVTCNTEDAAAVEQVRGVRVYRLPCWNLIEGRVPVPRPSRQLFGLWRRLVAHPPDVVVSNNHFFPTSLLATSLAKATRRPHLHIAHGSGFVEVDRQLLDRATRLYERLVGGWVLRNANQRCGVSQAVADFVMTFGVPDCQVLHNAIDLDAVRGDNTDFRSRLGLGGDDLLITCVGRLIEAKGARDLAQAFRMLQRNDRTHLAFAGTGPLAAELEALAAVHPKIHMLGRLSPDEVQSLLRGSDILCHPSAYPEGLPTVLLEGAAAGVAMIATPMGGTGELITSGVSGLLVPPSRPMAIADALQDLINEPELRTKLGNAARRRVEEAFTWDTVADTCRDFLMRLLNGADATCPERDSAPLAGESNGTRSQSRGV